VTGLPSSDLGPRDVHVWLAVPEQIRDAPLLARYLALLSDDERERAARFRFDEHRHQFCVAHALVRTALSRYARVEPGAWRFSVGERGRPEIVAAPGVPPLRFNLSHAGGLVACAVALARDVGVDVEDATRRADIDAIARRYFSPSERSDLARPGSGRDRFFELWTLKEAYLKARGIGIAAGLEKISFALDAGAPIRIRLDPGFDDDDPASWQFALHRPTARHVLSVAVRRCGEPELSIVLRECVPLLA
jgi:4'-phosphopantetheinyl transferase